MKEKMNPSSLKIVSTGISVEMIREALMLDKKYYLPQYHLSLAQCLGYYAKNDQIYTMLLYDDHVIGYMNFSPISEEKYDEIATGKSIDTSICAQDICSYEEDHVYSAYLSSIVIDEQYRNNGLGNLLIKILTDKIAELYDKKIFFKRIIADVLNDAGMALARNFGLQALKTTQNNSVLFETSLMPLKMQETEYNKKILLKYAGEPISNMNNKYDLFISYAKKNFETAQYVVDRLESKGLKCFIAPRDIKTGANYAVEIVSAISDATAVLLVFSQESDKSGYVLREINSAVSRNKTIIPMKIEEFTSSEAMEFYLGVTQWLDAYPDISEAHINEVLSIVNGIKGQNVVATEQKKKRIIGPQLCKISEAASIGFSGKDILMKEIELDYLCIPQDKYTMNDDTEGTIEEWLDAIQYEEDTSILLITNDEIKGFCDLYPVTPESYEDLISGKVIVRSDMIDLYDLGGEFNMYIAMIAISPELESQKNYLLFFDWIISHLREWKDNNIEMINLGISVYSEMLEKFVKKFGFSFKGLNPAKGKVYEISKTDLISNEMILKRYGVLDL